MARAVNHDDDFEPKLGRIRHGGSKSGRRFVQRVLAAASLSGKKGTTFHGNRIGRGVGAGRVLASRDRYAAFRQRRVIIKSRVIKLKGGGVRAAAQHLRYIQRDGVTRDGQAGELYNAENDRTEMKPFLERCSDDRHQFRVIVSAEDGAEYEDLKPLTRRLMQQMEEDLGTKLDWVAVDHFNTSHPHTHIVLRGKDDHGHDLIIARDYMAEGMRERAAEIVALDLGPKTDRQVEDRLRGEVDQERLTSIDRELMGHADNEDAVAVGQLGGDPFRQTLRAGRLKKLERLGLADEIAPGRWRFAKDLEPVLRRMGERGDIIKTLHRELSMAGLIRDPQNYAIYDAGDATAKTVTGRVAGRGLSDELNDRHYLVVDGVDGRAHYIDVGTSGDEVAIGSIIRVTPRVAEARDVDRTVARIAERHGGRYSVDLHMADDPRASRAFVETHIRRLESMRRLSGVAEREPEGTWKIAPDHLDRAVAYERNQTGKAPVVIEPLSRLVLQAQLHAVGATWLDRTLTGDGAGDLRDAGFGHEVNAALNRRRQWLMEQGYASQQNGKTIYRADMLAALTRRELATVGASLTKDTGLSYVEAGKKIEGVYRRSLDLASGKFAVIEKSREFLLVPWRPELERYLGKTVSGVGRGDGISWSAGRGRSGPAI